MQRTIQETGNERDGKDRDAVEDGHARADSVGRGKKARAHTGQGGRVKPRTGRSVRHRERQILQTRRLEGVRATMRCTRASTIVCEYQLG